MADEVSNSSSTPRACLAPSAAASSPGKGPLGQIPGLGGGLGPCLPPKSARGRLKSAAKNGRPTSAPSLAPPIGKRTRTVSTEDLLRIDTGTGNSINHVAEPLLQPLPTEPNALPESMCSFVARVREALAANVSFLRVASIERDGLYIHKRPIRGLGPSNPLSAGGTVFYHVLLYVRHKGRLSALDYGPASMDDVTANFMQAVDARPVLNGKVGGSSVPSEDTAPFVWIDAPLRHLEDSVVSQAMEFVNSKQYHAINNNCIHVTDFLVRVLTGGLVKFAPLLYDGVCGDVPSVDPPILMMVPLLMQKTWHQICDGSELMKEFLSSHSFPPLVVQEEDAKRHEEEEMAAADHQPPKEEAHSSSLTVAHGHAGPTSDIGDDQSFHSHNYWKAPYLMQLHVVPDDL